MPCKSRCEADAHIVYIAEHDQFLFLFIGYLEPEPTMTEMGCECMLPYSFIPKSLDAEGEGGRAIYTTCTDSGAVEPKSAWCPVKNKYVYVYVCMYESCLVSCEEQVRTYICVCMYV